MPVASLVLFLCAMLAAWLADRLTRSKPVPASAGSAGTQVTIAVLAGLLLARVAHVAFNFDAYQHEAGSIVDFRDGGWNAIAGLAGAAAWLAWAAWHHVAWRRALGTAGAGGLALWGIATLTLAALAPRELPDVLLTDLATGQPVRLREVGADRPVVLNLWATWCGPCRREMPVLAQAQARHPGVVFVFANQGEAPEQVRRYLEGERLALQRVLLDSPSRLGPALGSQGLPTTVFFDRSGTRTGAHMGALNAAALATRLQSLQAP